MNAFTDMVFKIENGLTLNFCCTVFFRTEKIIEMREIICKTEKVSYKNKKQMFENVKCFENVIKT